MVEAIEGGPERPPFTPAGLAARWGCSTTLVYDLLAAEALNGFRLGKLWRIPAAAVDEYESASSAPGAMGREAPEEPLPDGPSASTQARLARLEG